MGERGRLAGRAGIVTGASRGIGRAIARRLLAEGASVVVTATSREGAQRAAADLGAGERVVALGSDAADEDWDAVQDVNLRGAFLLVQEAARAMVEGGRIVLVASTNAFAPEGGSFAYDVSKAGVVGLARAAALELAPAGVTVNAVAPGLVATDMTASVTGDPLTSGWYLDRIPAGRFGRPEDVAGAVAYLVSDDAAWVTGTHLVVDGGQTVGLDLPDPAPTPGGRP